MSALPPLDSWTAIELSLSGQGWTTPDPEASKVIHLLAKFTGDVNYGEASKVDFGFDALRLISSDEEGIKGLDMEFPKLKALCVQIDFPMNGLSELEGGEERDASVGYVAYSFLGRVVKDLREVLIWEERRVELFLVLTDSEVSEVSGEPAVEGGGKNDTQVAYSV